MKIPTNNMKQYSATIGFWLLIGARKENMFMVVPALVSDHAVEKVDRLGIKDVWNVAVQGPVDADPDTKMLLIPEVITVKGIDKKASKMKHLLEIDAVKDKCEVLTNQYIEHVRKISQGK
jgi:hypothetical protein